ncbi:hypothetical protein ACRE_070930 [Hapsidospora chrysogenum ATCC 11550]|uniref:Cyanovirin-N domain-containing protein n=1 Tax=Hapsidospora chrysogenum (strain ATCC 11550 / CBS 779.69 / DSM 880 / IAM 14645 / JCM 23072 / IMI 49137) TaxID=857340 RepID=A0A086SYH8_HAPC1|nr:hypothetical protein ACRE_070930 [Hapsidospora chrysogenum ATCC 11550]
MHKLSYLLAASAAATLYGATGTAIAIAIEPPRNLQHQSSDEQQQLGPRNAYNSKAWNGFLDNNCWDVRFYLSDDDMARDDPAGTFEPYLGSPVLNARCLDLQGNEVCSTLQLGECFWNQDGHIKFGDGGHFHESCTKCSVTDGKLWCYCLREGDLHGGNVLRETEIDLNAYIHNFNGQMTCDWKERARFSDCPKEDSFYPDY